MSHYMEKSTQVYQIYLKYIAPEDIHIYSIDEVFIDLTYYLPASGRSARDFAREIIGASCGITIPSRISGG